MSDFVIDNSVVCAWLFEDQKNAYADAVGRSLQTCSAVAPPLLQLEYANVLRTACKRSKLNAARAYELLTLVESLPIRIETSSASTAEVLDLALRYELTSYDASYLDLALRLRIPIATLDAALVNAALVSGAGVVRLHDELA